jgi:hypothetical protein
MACLSKPTITELFENVRQRQLKPSAQSLYRIAVPR